MNKKQKRAVLEAKRARELEETRQEGLRAQAKDREARIRRQQAAAKKKQDELEAREAEKRELKRLEQEALYEQYLAEEARARRERGRQAILAMASHG